MHYQIDTPEQLEGLFSKPVNEGDTISTNLSDPPIVDEIVKEISKGTSRQAQYYRLENDNSIQKYASLPIIIFRKFDSSLEYIYPVD
ncbi:MAG: hypothetical protein JKY86_12325 [Gammaproteobacteria bacterium]|nr:hypothetical protein [Gammaproteobacteria bacterium]